MAWNPRSRIRRPLVEELILAEAPLILVTGGTCFLGRGNAAYSSQKLKASAFRFRFGLVDGVADAAAVFLRNIDRAGGELR